MTLRLVSTQPAGQILRDEIIVIEVRVAVIDAINLFHLSGRQFFARIETPAACQQTLPPQNLVQAGDAPGKIVRRVEQHGIRVGDFSRPRQRVESPAIRARRFDRLLCPARQPSGSLFNGSQWIPTPCADCITPQRLPVAFSRR